MPSDSYRTLARSESREIPRIKGSRFIGEAHPVRDEAEVERILESIRRREHAATHHCFAYRLGPGGDTFRANDDGEPSGTAGAPILRQIESRDLTYVLVTVVRYYGGTKLGRGGLARAYGEAAAAVLENCPKLERVLRTAVRLRFAYDDTSPAMHLIGAFDAVVAGSDYGVRTELVVQLPQGEVDVFLEAFTNALGGRGDADIVDADVHAPREER